MLQLEETMKRQILLVCLTAIMVMSCRSTYEITINENIPENLNAKIYLNSTGNDGWFYVSKWNDVDIKEELYGDKKWWGDGDEVILNVPAGINKITFDIEFNINNPGKNESGTYKSRDVEMQYYFDAGKTYRIRGRLEKSTTLFLKRPTATLYIGLYDITSKAKLLEERRIPKSLF